MAGIKIQNADLAAVRSRGDTSARSVEYFFDQPNVVRRPADGAASGRSLVLAAFDADNAVVWANEAFLRLVERKQRNRQHLNDEDVETLTHEFARVLHYRDIFEDHFLHEDRVTALRKRRSLQVTRSTVESYTNQKLAQERRAEELVQRVRMEILSSFDRAQRGRGLSMSAIADKAEEFAAGLVRELRDDYVASARREFSRLHGAGGDVSRSVRDVYSATDSVQKKVLSVRKIRWLFPTDQSATLADLVDELIGFNIDIVVPVAVT